MGVAPPAQLSSAWPRNQKIWHRNKQISEERTPHTVHRHHTTIPFEGTSNTTGPPSCSTSSNAIEAKNKTRNHPPTIPTLVSTRHPHAGTGSSLALASGMPTVSGSHGISFTQAIVALCHLGISARRPSASSIMTTLEHASEQ